VKYSVAEGMSFTRSYAAEMRLLDFPSHPRMNCSWEVPVPHLSPQTLTQAEQRTLLRATSGNRRDHLIYSLALGTGLRLTEIVGLNVGDLYTTGGKPKNRVRLRPEIAKNGRAGDVFLPDALLAKFRRFWRHNAARRDGLRPEDPLFCSQSRTRISPRRVQFAFRTWQVKAGFDRLYPFHCL